MARGFRRALAPSLARRARANTLLLAQANSALSLRNHFGAIKRAAISINGGKPIKESRDVDLPLAAQHFFYHAGWADKLGWALRAACTARSTSVSSATATLASARPVAGLRVTNVSPECGSTNSPPMNNP